MALVFKGTRCSLCGSPIGTDKPYFATSGLFVQPEDPLWRFCDSAMHWDCYLEWPDQKRFAEAYVDSWVENEKQNPYWCKVYHDENAFVTVSLHEAVGEVCVLLYKTGSQIRFPLEEWGRWETDEDAVAIVKRKLHPMEKEVLMEVLPLLRKKYPTKDAMDEAIDWPAKVHLAETIEENRRQEEAERIASYAEHNERCAEWARKLKQEGLTCPHCRKHSKDIRFIDKTGQGKSYFICRLCGSSFSP